MSTTRVALVTIALAVVLGSCRDGVEPEDELTEEEVLALAEGVVRLAAGSGLRGFNELEEGIERPCPRGGRVTLTGTATEGEAGNTWSVDVVVTPLGCELLVDEEMLTLDGNPNVRGRLSVEIVGFFEHVSVSGSVTGGVSWQFEDRSGDCGIDVELDVDVGLSDPGTPQPSGGIEGVVCGHHVEIDVGEFADSS